MKENTVGTTEINACGEFVRPIWQSSMKQESCDSGHGGFKSDYLSDFNTILEEAQENYVRAGELLESKTLEEYLTKYPEVEADDWLRWYSDEGIIQSRALWNSSSGECGWLNPRELAPSSWEASAAVQTGRERRY